MKQNMITIGCLNNGADGLAGLQKIVLNYMLSILKNGNNVKFKMPPKLTDKEWTTKYEYYMNDELFCCIKTDDGQFYILESYISIDELFRNEDSKPFSIGNQT